MSVDSIPLVGAMVDPSTRYYLNQGHLIIKRNEEETPIKIAVITERKAWSLFLPCVFLKRWREYRNEDGSSVWVSVKSAANQGINLESFQPRQTIDKLVAKILKKEEKKSINYDLFVGEEISQKHPLPNPVFYQALFTDTRSLLKGTLANAFQEKKLEAQVKRENLIFIHEDLKRPIFITPKGEAFILLVDADEDKMLGSGAHKSAYDAIDLRTGKIRVALCAQDLLSEYVKTKQLKRGIKSFGVARANSEEFEVVKKFEGDLFEFSKDYQFQLGNDPEKLRNIIYQMIREVKKLHDKGYVHKDIKLENFLIKQRKNGSFKVKLIDFDFTSRPGKTTDLFGTRDFLSPELVRSEMEGQRDDFVATQTEDLWALGVNLYRMVSFIQDDNRIWDTLYQGVNNGMGFLERHEQLNANIVNLKEDFVSVNEPNDTFGKIIWNLLRLNPRERWTASQVLAEIQKPLVNRIDEYLEILL